ncbi:MAG: hypothetical protein HZC41_19620 [Chloroflexi bacterium]|nr:hypothetical protein [Chloroflexota bacterium]
MSETTAAGDNAYPDFFNFDMIGWETPEGPAGFAAEPPSMRELVTALLRVGAAAMILCILTGVRELGIAVAMASTAWLYYRL